MERRSEKEGIRGRGWGYGSREGMRDRDRYIERDKEMGG
jgi:hypothetical protein